MVKKVKKLVAPKPLQNVRFDSSLIMVLLAALILLISFLIYSNSSMKTPTETIEEENFFGSECTVDSDCPQPRCPGMKGVCEGGYCIIKQTGPSTAKCIDLQTTLCGNDICEAEEKETCPEDCTDLGGEIEQPVCGNGICEEGEDKMCDEKCDKPWGCKECDEGACPKDCFMFAS